MFDAKSLVSEASSVHCRSATVFDDNETFELQQHLEKCEREIIELKFENTIFEAAVERKKSEFLIPQSSSLLTPVSSSQATTPIGSYQDSSNTNATGRVERLARKQSKSRSTQSDIRIRLTLEQKLAIVASEYEQIKTEALRRNTVNERNTDQSESDIEWIDVELEDFQLAITELLKLKESSIDKRTRKVIGEKMSRYFHEHLQARESTTNKLRDRSGGLRKQIVRLDSQLKQKEEMGETLHEVDFNQLKIENKQYLDKIDEKNVELVLLKRQVAKVTQLLNHYKDNLHTSTVDLIDIEKRINKQDHLHEYAEKEIVAVNNEQYHVAKTHNNLVSQIENYQVPEILDYVRKKSLLSNLQRDCQVWQRKVELVSMSLRQSRQQWETIQGAARLYNRNNI
ncbi:unnamed protein product [Rotaria socialis]|uniref:Cilia- and flagella-associated protein 263 n=1 Tax=Rotaria socialis TaxID=392032 RepID=A0A818DZJ3_9BILA|nr:unnamed protein product [Rotaria socialis]